MSKTQNQVAAEVSYTLDGKTYAFSAETVAGSTLYTSFSSSDDEPKVFHIQYLGGQVVEGEHTYQLENLKSVVLALDFRNEYKIVKSGELKLDVKAVNGKYEVVGRILAAQLSNGLKDLDLNGHYSYVLSAPMPA
ncbi:hypothetical protein [Pseudomonas moraviensis]|uniref:Uncharacterized protein n=1 Tax=Pseudomonas moraviensis TaxID=321662 RepID=A0A7Z0AUB9_9PSED|nr:hypothetical protein [Pseudomonas moraviensis]NYH09498.1 hypothetical protein [Pseudomonas moraviensis]